MSASERLKALEFDTLFAQTHEQMLVQVLEQVTPLISALPQIVAVVEAAEKHALEMHGTPPVPKHPRLVAALTALEEALS